MNSSNRESFMTATRTALESVNRRTNPKRMPVLTRRRSRDARQEVWHVFYGDVRVGLLGERAGVPVDVDQWGFVGTLKSLLRCDRCSSSLSLARSQ